MPGKWRPHKWRVQKVYEKVEQLLDRLKSDDDICYINSIFRDDDLTVSTFKKWRKYYSKDNAVEDDYGSPRIKIMIAEIRTKMEKIDEILQDRLINGALKGHLNAKFTQFLIVNKYKDEFRNESHIDHTSKGDKMAAPVIYIPDNGRDQRDDKDE